MRESIAQFIKREKRITQWIMFMPGEDKNACCEMLAHHSDLVSQRMKETQERSSPFPMPECSGLVSGLFFMSFRGLI